MSFNFSKHKENLLFVPLGGSNEIGMNLNLYHYKGKWIIIDCGIGFADDYLPGIDVVVPNIDMLEDIKDDILGMIITHSHEDHVGAVPYLWGEIGCPVYATKFTCEFLKHKMTESQDRKQFKATEMKPGELLELGPFTIDIVPLTHSIPEMHAIAIKTDAGVVMHTGDWKLDGAPMVGPTTDEETLKKYGDEGVLAMVCDSTNVFQEGHSGSEGDVRTHLTEVISQCESRVFVSTFASNIARLETIIRAGIEAGRSVALAGKSLWRITETAKASGYLKDIPPLLHDHEAMDLPREKCMIICTGCQGESRAALTKIVRDEHPVIRTSQGDHVIFSSKIIPGNETKIGWLHNQLVLKGLEIITEKNAFIHVSGHPARAELEHVYNLVRPKIAVPTHGEARHLQEHVYFAQQLGIPEQILASNGAVMRLEEGNAALIGHTHSGYIAVDGKSLIDTDSPIISTRRKLRDEGGIFVSLIMDKKYKLKTLPKVSAPGSLDQADDKDIIFDIVEEISESLSGLTGKEKQARVEEITRSAVRRILRREIGKKPPIVVHVATL